MLGVLADSIPRILDQGWTFFFADNRLILCRFSIDECFDGGGLVTEERDQTNDDAGDDVGRDLNFNVTLKTLIQINGDDEDGEGILRIVVYKRRGEGKESIGRRGRGGRFGHDTMSSCRKDIDGGRNSHRMRFVKEEFSTSRERFDVERLAYLMKLEVASEANPGNESKRKLKKRRRRAKTTKRGSEVNGDCLKVNHDGSDGHFDEDGAEDESSGRISVKEDRLNSDGHFDGDDDDKDELICRSRSPLSISRDDGEDVALQGIQTGRVISELPSDSFSPNPSLGDAKDFSVSHADSSFSLVSLDGVDEGSAGLVGEYLRESNRTKEHLLNLKQHRQKRSQKHRCEHCAKAFSNKSSLSVHLIWNHSADKPHKCSLCDSAFKTKPSLKNHVASVHSNERPHICDQCPSTFKLRTQLQVHVKQQHLGVKRERKTCPICNKDFAGNFKLREHVAQNHTGERAEECPDCGKRFVSKPRLKEHMQVHQESRHQCHMCDKLFRWKHTLKEHLRAHAGIRPYICPYCAATFSDNRALKQHSSKIHGQMITGGIATKRDVTLQKDDIQSQSSNSDEPSQRQIPSLEHKRMSDFPSQQSHTSANSQPTQVSLSPQHQDLSLSQSLRYPQLLHSLQQHHPKKPL